MLRPSDSVCMSLSLFLCLSVFDVHLSFSSMPTWLLSSFFVGNVIWVLFLFCQSHREYYSAQLSLIGCDFYLNGSKSFIEIEGLILLARSAVNFLQQVFYFLCFIIDFSDDITGKSHPSQSILSLVISFIHFLSIIFCLSYGLLNLCLPVCFLCIFQCDSVFVLLLLPVGFFIFLLLDCGTWDDIYHLTYIAALDKWVHLWLNIVYGSGVMQNDWGGGVGRGSWWWWLR